MWLFFAFLTLNTALAVSTTANWQQRSATGLLVFIALTSSDFALAILLIGSRRDGRRRLLRDIAVRSECKRLARLRHPFQPKELPSMHARVAILLSPLFPLGLMLAQPAFFELREHPHPQTRAMLLWTVAISITSGVATIGTLTAIALDWTPIPQ